MKSRLIVQMLLLSASCLFVSPLSAGIGNCDDCSKQCKKAKDEAESTRNELERLSQRFASCIEDNDLTEECFWEFRRMKSSYSDFESDVSDVNSYCD